MANDGTPRKKFRSMDEGVAGAQENEGNHDDVIISFPGERFNFTYLAASSYFQKISYSKGSYCIQLQPVRNYKEVFDAIMTGSAAYGVVPLESSSRGTIHHIYDKLLLSDGQVVVVGEIGASDSHHLCCSSPDLTLEDVRTIIGHPHMLECCSDYLDVLDQLHISQGKRPMERIGAWDSSVAASMVSKKDDSMITSAAVCSEEAAAFHKLRVLKSHIGNDLNAETRYIILAKKGSDPLGLLSTSINSSSTHRKSSIALALRNIPGAIFKMSSCFALRDIDIIKIESRPASTAMKVAPYVRNESSIVEAGAFSQRHWDLIFYVDYVPSANEATNQAVIANLQEYSLWIRELGHYNSDLKKVQVKPANWGQLLDIISIG